MYFNHEAGRESISQFMCDIKFGEHEELYKTNPCILEELKESIKNEIRNITVAKLFQSEGVFSVQLLSSRRRIAIPVSSTK